MPNLDDYQLTTVFAASLIVIFAASELGRLLGLRAVGRGGGDVSTLEGATLGLLALMIGFTFAMALARFDARRDAVVNEANAIGTTALRSRLLPAQYRTEALKDLQEYVQLRLDLTRSEPTADRLRAVVVRSNELQERLWQNTMALAAKDAGIVPTGVFVQALNQMIDEQGKRLEAVHSRVPNIVFLTLYGVAVVAFIFVGYANGLETRRLRLPVYLMGAIVAAVILLIQDLDRPAAGFISVSQQPMIDVAASIKGYGDQAP